MRDLLNFFDKPTDPIRFENVKISLSGPEKIRQWSHGEVKKPETINYRTFKPEKDGLFCAKIFGPIKDYECLCGKYKRMKYRGVICEKCGVEVTQAKVRRERLGHIELASPVAHVWYLRSLPSRISAMLGVTLKDVERVLYCQAYMVTDPADTELKMGQILSEEEYEEAQEKFNDSFEADVGGSAIKENLRQIDLLKLCDSVRERYDVCKSETEKKSLMKRLKIAEAFRESGNSPAEMMVDVLPVLPPDLRPLVPLDGGRFATSDLNDLYRRVINRNNRLKRLLELGAPGIIIRNEKRMLQESVDALFDNGRRGKVFTGSNKRPLRSLSDTLKGKTGRFRQNLLGKRVDYSGRSVIVVGPELKLHQVGIPKKMALELFKPFIYNKLEERGFVTTIKSAKKMVENEADDVWDILAEVVKEHPVLVNRAPTLHRLGLQAFEPVLVEGKAIQLHPLVCTAFNADFDGDQVAVHVPLSIEAQIEARVLMMSTNNILKPADGRPIINPSQDIVLGIYYLTRARPGAVGEGRIFKDREEVAHSHTIGQVDLQAKIYCRINGERVDTTVGRVILSEIIPTEIPFAYYNKTLDKKACGELLDHAYRKSGPKTTVILADKLRTIGYTYATMSGTSIAMNDMIIPSTKEKYLDSAYKEVQQIEDQYTEGLITDGERYNKVIDIWSQITENISTEMMREIGSEKVTTAKGEEVETQSFNPIYMMADSGARGSAAQIKQLAGMRGLMAKPSGEIIETPITANFREGLTVLQYFISTHGARKGLADTALKTANSGYLTRRLVDVAQDAVITKWDCGSTDGLIASTALEGDETGAESVSDRILGRVTSEDVIDPTQDNKVIMSAGEMIDEEKVMEIQESGVEKMRIRSVLTCKNKFGLCAKCYGRDLARGHIANIGEAVGVIAAESIGEPGTQLTMRTFHIGGAATRKAEKSATENKYSGTVQFERIITVKNREGSQTVMSRNGELTIVDSTGRERERHRVLYGSKLLIKDKSEVEPGTVLVEWDPYSNPIMTGAKGKVKYVEMVDGMTIREQIDEVTGLTRRVVIEEVENKLKPRISVEIDGGETKFYNIPAGTTIVVEDGDQVEPGDWLAKIPRESGKTKDITGGLPRVAELFEARKPKDASIIADFDGSVTFGDDTKGKRKVILTSQETKEEKEYLVARGKHIIVQEGDFVKQGERLVDGSASPHDILAVLGPTELAKFLVEEIQEVYRLQGVTINNKHIEVIVRQMLRKVKVKTRGDTRLLEGEQVDKYRLKDINEKVVEMGGEPAVSDPLLLGITRASLATESWISAASFQETTKVLTEASIEGKIDNLRGLKENVSMGRLIPAGTGLKQYQSILPVLDIEEEDLPVGRAFQAPPIETDDSPQPPAS